MPSTLLNVAAKSAVGPDSTAGRLTEYAPRIRSNVTDLERWGSLALGGGLVGINNRSLRTFEVDLKVTKRLAPLAPPGALLVSESGIFTPDDVRCVSRVQAGAVLVGESLMRQADVEAATRALLR